MSKSKIILFTILRVIKIIFGVILCILGITYAIMAITEQNALWLIGTGVCAIPAFFLLKKTKTEKEIAKIRKNKNIADNINLNENFVVESVFTPSETPKQTAIDMRQSYTASMAKKDFKELQENYKIASSTHNLDTFVKCYNSALQLANTLLQAYRVGVKGIEKLNYCEMCNQVINSSASLKSVALNNFSQYEIAQADTMKSNADKLKQYIEVYNKLTMFEDEFLFIDEYENQLNNIKNNITALGGSIPEN